MQRTFYGQLRAILYQIKECGIEVNSDCCTHKVVQPSDLLF